MKRIKAYITNTQKREPEDVGFFNAGQKLYFWLLAFGLIFLLITGILIWFDHVTPRWVVAISYVVHDIAALALLAGFIVHIYESTAHQPGTFRSMIDGTVTEDWARTHHPAWYNEVTGDERRDDRT